MEVFKEKVPKAVEILGDILLNSVYNKNQLEYERQTILQELEEVNKDNMEVLMENVYFNCFREHSMGMPILGDRANIESVTQEMVKAFHATNYIGNNMVVVATGDIKHEEIVDMVETHFGKAEREAPSGLIRPNEEKPAFTPAMMMIRDDEMINSNVGIFYDAPHWMHQDYYAFLIIERIFGAFSVERNAEHLNDVSKQYNSLHAMLAEMVDVTKHQAIYSPYADAAIFGNYFFGNEVFTKQMNYAGLLLPTLYSDYVT